MIGWERMNNDELTTVEEKTQDKKGDVRIGGRFPSEEEEIKRKIEEETSDPKEKSHKSSDLIRREEDIRRKSIIAIVVLIILFLLLIAIGILASFELAFFIAVLTFIIILGGISTQIKRKKGKFYFTSNFSLSEHYKYYLKKLIKLLNDYNGSDDEEYRRSCKKRIIYCMKELYNLTLDWYNPPQEIYIDLFTHDLDEFNSKLRVLLLRLNGFIDKLEKVPSDIIDNLERLLGYFDKDSLKLTQGHLNCLNHSIKYLEENHPIVHKLEFYEPKISKAVRKFWSKRRKEVIILSYMFIMSIIYWVCVTLIDLGLDNNTKFMFWGIIIMAPGITALFIQIVKRR